MSIAAVVLAAGSSSRLGRPKQLVRVGGRSLLRRTVDCALEAGCRPVEVVLGAGAARIRRELDGLPVGVTLNARWHEGLAASIRAGILTLLDAPEVAAAVLLACDQPGLTPEVLRQICRAFDGTAGRTVACEYAGTVGVPALFERSRFPELLALSGPGGARGLLLRHPARLTRIAWPGGAADVDAPADLAPAAGDDAPAGPPDGRCTGRDGDL